MCVCVHSRVCACVYVHVGASVSECVCVCVCVCVCACVWRLLGKWICQHYQLQHTSLTLYLLPAGHTLLRRAGAGDQHLAHLADIWLWNNTKTSSSAHCPWQLSSTHHNYCSLSTGPSPLIFHTPQLLQSVNTSIPSHLSHTTTTAVCQQVHPLSSFTHNYCSLSTGPSPLIFHTPQLLQSVNTSIPSHLSHTTTTAVCQHVHPLSSFTHHNYCSLSTGPSPLIFHTPQLLQSVNTSIPSHLSHTTTTAVNRSIPSHLSHTTTTSVCQQVHPLSSFTHHNYCSLSTGPSPLIFHTPQLLQSVNTSIPSHLSHTTTTAVCQQVHPLSSFTQVGPEFSMSTIGCTAGQCSMSLCLLATRRLGLGIQWAHRSKEDKWSGLVWFSVSAVRT